MCYTQYNFPQFSREEYTELYDALVEANKKVTDGPKVKMRALDLKAVVTCRRNEGGIRKKKAAAPTTTKDDDDEEEEEEEEKRTDRSVLEEFEYSSMQLLGVLANLHQVLDNENRSASVGKNNSRYFVV